MIGKAQEIVGILSRIGSGIMGEVGKTGNTNIRRVICKN